MASQETGKQHARRIPLDYFKRRNPLERWKLWLAGAALLAAVAWWASGWARGDRGRLRYSHGPLAAVHATWEAHCNACHVPFVPIGTKTWATALVHPTETSDTRCETCHAGPVHHANQNAGLTPACAGCHRDHQGREVSLVWLVDGDCTQCHRDLVRGMKDHADHADYENVSRFETGHHPEFKVLRTGAPDPGKLKFNHALHLSPGMVGTADEKPLFTLAQLRAEDRERYRRAGQKDRDPVQLDCQSCHRLDSRDFWVKQIPGLPASILPVRSSGAYMQPIIYENQCRACHPLSVEPGAAHRPQAPGLTVPHRLQPDQVQRFLRDAFAAEYLVANPQVLDQRIARRRMPGKATDEESARTYIADKVFTAEKILYLEKQTCAECHRIRTPDGGTDPKLIHRDTAAELRIEPTNVPEVWFPHAVFDHAAHRAVSCRACHERAYPDSSDPSRTSADVLVPGIHTCLECHRPSGGSVGVAESDCTVCHRYHNGAHPLQGVGAAARDAAVVRDTGQGLTIKTFRSDPQSRAATPSR